MRPHFTTALVFLVLFTSCGLEKLDRDKAADLIKEFYGYPRVEFGMLDVSSKKLAQAGWGHVRSNNYESRFYFNDVGYLKNPEQNHKGFDNSRMARDFGGAKVEVIANCNDFVEITGIALDEAGKTAKVEFTCRRVGVTPLGSLLGRKDGDILNYTVNMQLYDDGWRITENKQENIKPETYHFYDSKGQLVQLTGDVESEGYVLEGDPN